MTPDSTSASSDEPGEPVDPTVYPDRETYKPEVIENAEVGDRLHMEFPSLNGDVDWRSAWVTATGDGFVETNTGHRIEITDEDEYARRSYGDEGVKLLEDVGGDWVNEDWSPSLNDVERVPVAAFDSETWFEWEIHVSEVMGGGVSTDQVVFPEAPSRDVAEVKAKRWAEMESGYTPVVYQEDRVRVPDELQSQLSDRDGEGA